jgi:hypothetical protein
MAMTDQAEPPIDPRAAARREGEAETWDGKAIRDWISTPHGRRLMERFLDHCQVYARRYHHDGDPYGMAWRDGRADAGNFLQGLMLEHCSDLFLLMMKERGARLERARKQAEREAARRDPATEPVRMTGVEAMADDQAAEAEEMARREREAAKPKKKG